MLMPEHLDVPLTYEDMTANGTMLGTDLGTQWMITYRQNGVATPYSGFNVGSGWGYRDSFGYSDSTVNNACTHGCRVPRAGVRG